MKINVMIITPCFGYGGLEQVVINIVEQINKTNFNISLCTLLKPDPERMKRISNTGIPLFVMNKREGVDISIPIKLDKILRRENIDIINSHDVGATLYAAIASVLSTKRIIVHTDHSEILGRKHIGVYRYILREKVDYCITVSEHLRQYLIEKIGVSKAKAKTIPNGIDLEQFKQASNKTDIRNELDINSDEYIVGSVGRLTKQKGYEYLLRAINILSEDGGRIRLVIAGDGEMRNELKLMAKELQIDDRVIFAGHRNDIPNLLKTFDVFVLSSLWEGQPITIIEAMAAGVPIVVTDVGGNGEILGRGKYGLLVPSRDPVALAKGISTFLNDEMLRNKISKDAQSYAWNNLSHIAMVKEYERVFESLI